MSKRYWSVEEVAEYLGVKKSWVYDASYKNRIPRYQMGRLLRFDPVEVETWMQTQRKGPDIQLDRLDVAEDIKVKEVK